MAGGEGSPEGSPAVQGGNEGEFGSNEGRDGSVREQDRFLPIANISRIMKKALPANAKIAKDAKETVQECVSEFISFITSEASDKCQREKRKTINGDDLLWSMSTLGFEDYVEPLKIYLRKYREVRAPHVPTAVAIQLLVIVAPANPRHAAACTRRDAAPRLPAGADVCPRTPAGKPILARQLPLQTEVGPTAS